MILTEEKIKEKLQAYTGWEFKNESLVKTYRFSDFMNALQFVNKAGIIAESLDHHPDILIHYNQVTFTSTTHSEAGVTEKDFNLIKEIEKQAVESI